MKLRTRVRVCFVLFALAAAVMPLASPVLASQPQSSVSAPTLTRPQSLATASSGFVRGVYGKDSSKSGSDVMASLGFNTVMTGSYRQLLDPLATKGLKGIVWLGQWLNLPSCKFERDDATITSQVKAIAGHPAILAYYIGDEPHVSECPNAPAMFKKRSDIIHSLDPGSTTFTVIQQSENGTVRNYAPWAGSVDVIGFDIYPCSKASSTCNFTAIDAAIAAIYSAGIKRFWAIPQDFQDCYYRLPTPQELGMQFDHWAKSSMSGYLVFSWNYQAQDPKCVGTNLESHPDNVAALKAVNSRTFVESTGRPAQPPAAVSTRTLIRQTLTSPAFITLSIVGVLVIGIAVALLVRRRRRSPRA